MLDAGSRSFYAVASIGNDHFVLPGDARDDGANGIVAPVSGAFGLRDGQLHKLLFRFVGSRDHAEPWRMSAVRFLHQKYNSGEGQQLPILRFALPLFRNQPAARDYAAFFCPSALASGWPRSAAACSISA